MESGWACYLSAALSLTRALNSRILPGEPSVNDTGLKLDCVSVSRPTRGTRASEHHFYAPPHGLESNISISGLDPAEFKENLGASWAMMGEQYRPLGT